MSISALSDAAAFDGPRISRSSQQAIFNAITLCFLIMAGTWIAAAIISKIRQNVPGEPKAIAVAVPQSTPAEVANLSGADPIFADPGLASAFRHAPPSFGAGSFQLAAAFPPAQAPAPMLANVPVPPSRDPGLAASPENFELAAAASPPTIPAPLPADVPLPPSRDAGLSPAPEIFQLAGAPPSHDTAALLPATIPLPPVRDVPIVATNLPSRPSRPDAAPPLNRVASPRTAVRTAPEAIAANVAPSAPDNRNLFQKLFNLPAQKPGPALAYARPDEDGIGRAPNYARPNNVPLTDGRTAVYDISAHTVYLPNGEQLEAHSGLGRLIDDPGYVNAKDRGATPPHVYALTLREKLFHGVQALRLNPVGGGNMYGRVGLLAHTYMLGPNGQSNGCVSFRDYRRFLQAYLRGEVERLLVVGHRA